MTWTKLSDDFAQHPKIIAAGERAELLHIHALIYSNRFLTDGRIPKIVALTLTHNAKADVGRLVELGIWAEVEQEYEIHDFLEYQPSRAEVLAKHKQKASAGRAGGQATARARAQANAVAERVAESKPVPVPVPVPDLSGFVRDNALREGTVPKGTPNGELESIGELLQRFGTSPK